eukprot:scaffold73524_cov55-Prasinocladus_malaysianus.AAC.1
MLSSSLAVGPQISPKPPGWPERRSWQENCTGEAGAGGRALDASGLIRHLPRDSCASSAWA